MRIVFNTLEMSTFGVYSYKIEEHSIKKFHVTWISVSYVTLPENEFYDGELDSSHWS